MRGWGGRMSEGRLRVTTEEDRERLHAARRTGRLCAACGRTLGDGETAYLERFLVGARALSGSQVVTYASDVYAPVGAECASSAFLEQTAGTEPERCAGCGRGVYYRSIRPTRRQALCSKRCAAHAATAKRMARVKREG
jgi:hypothetical protein